MADAEQDMLLHAYLDGELDARASLEFERALTDSADLRRRFEEARALREMLREKAPRHRAPVGLRRRVAALSEPRIAARRDWLRWPAAGAFAAVVALALVTVLRTADNDERIVREVLAGHARAMLTGRVIEVASSDRHVVKPWLGGKLDFSPPVRDFEAEGFRLAGARLDYLDGRPVAALVYRHRAHVVDVFVWPSAASDGLRSHAERGYNLLRFSSAGMQFWAVSDLNPAELGELAALLRRPEASDAQTK
jgi:anti-sigma factor RsiW